jgi:hypothetical protein
MVNPVRRVKAASLSTAKPKQQSIAHCTASRCVTASKDIQKQLVEAGYMFMLHDHDRSAICIAVATSKC